LVKLASMPVGEQRRDRGNFDGREQADDSGEGAGSPRGTRRSRSQAVRPAPDYRTCQTHEAVDRLPQFAGLRQLRRVHRRGGLEQAGGDEPPTKRGGIRDALERRFVSPPESGGEVQARTASDEHELQISTRLVCGGGHT
jgi:hypothetical protein